MFSLELLEKLDHAAAILIERWQQFLFFLEWSSLLILLEFSFPSCGEMKVEKNDHKC